jgi:hypothetical protein
MSRARSNKSLEQLRLVMINAFYTLLGLLLLATGGVRIIRKDEPRQLVVAHSPAARLIGAAVMVFFWTQLLKVSAPY